jgi:cysteine dioxygenase
LDKPGCPKSLFPKLAPLVEYLDSLTGRADLIVLDRMLKELKVSRADISTACSFGTSGYKRNTISRSQHYELLALCWRSGHCTPIHDHKGVSCAFRVVEGAGTEIRFKVTDSGLICPVETNAMPAGYICSADEADIHQVANMQAPGLDLITLHIYSPAITKMNTYRWAEPTGADLADVYDC